MARHAHATAARWRWLSTLIPHEPGESGPLARMAILPPRREQRFALDHELPALQALIRRRGELCECLLEIDRDRNLVIQRSRLLPRAGDHRMRTGKMEISRNRRLAVDHVAETGDAILLAAIHHHR